MDESGKNAASFQLVVDEAQFGNDEGAKIHERRPPFRWFLISAEASHFEIMSRMEKTLSSQQPIGVKVDGYVRGSSSKRAASS